MEKHHSALNRLAILFLTVAGATLIVAPAGAQSTWRPERNVELVVGSTSGSGQNKSARFIQRIWKDAKLVEVTSSVVNKPGGGGAIADAYVSQHTGDAHTLMTASPTLLTSHITGRSKLNYTDYTPIALLFDEYIAFVVRPESAVKNRSDLIAALTYRCVRFLKHTTLRLR